MGPIVEPTRQLSVWLFSYLVSETKENARIASVWFPPTAKVDIGHSSYRVFRCPLGTWLVNGCTEVPMCGLHLTLTVAFYSVTKLVNYRTNVPCPYSYFGILPRVLTRPRKVWFDPVSVQAGNSVSTIGRVPRHTKAKMSGSQYCRGKLLVRNNKAPWFTDTGDPNAFLIILTKMIHRHLYT